MKRTTFVQRLVHPVIGSLWLALLAFALVCWPLPRYATRGIAASHRPEAGGPRLMIPGDHLQLLYHFQLMADYLSGATPWFYNLYEFNDGDDSRRYEPDAYYAPFSVFFALGTLLGGPAFGWNLSGFLALWMTALGTWMLLRRFIREPLLIVLATALGTLFPYRLVTFLHGSPTGFGMAYVPWFLLGLDLVVRGRRPVGGVLSGACFVLMAWADIHTYFFATLLAPFWCVFLYLNEGIRTDRRRIMETLRAFLPLVAFVIITAFQAWLIQRSLKTSVMSTGRTIPEVLAYSPSPQSFLALAPGHRDSLVHLTFSFLLILLVGLIFWGVRLLRRNRPRIVGHFLLYLCLLSGIVGIVMLSMGPRMPIHAGDVRWQQLCRLIPPYAMIRQPAKIFSILPPLLSVLVVLPFAGLPPQSFKRTLRIAALTLLSILILESAWRVRPTISLLDRAQQAYAAIRDDAVKDGEIPRALAIVLWPGDSHWSSLYQYYGMLYRIRMINGYRPKVPLDYHRDVFLRFKSLNRGYASSAQLDDLLAHGIRYVLLHEDAFPEQVSPFGVAQTLEGLLAHPRLALLRQDRSVWAFKILEAPSKDHVVSLDWRFASPSQAWDAVRLSARHARVEASPDDCVNGRYVALQTPDSMLTTPTRFLVYHPSLRLSIRLRGRGVLETTFSIQSQAPVTARTKVDAAQWTWVDVSFPPFSDLGQAFATLRAPSGAIDIDYLYLAQGDVPSDLQPGNRVFIPAPCLFHAGYTVLDRHAVRLTPASVGAQRVIYGPRLPLAAGTYRVRMHYTADDYDGPVGTIGFGDPTLPVDHEPVTVFGDQTVAETILRHPANWPVTFGFHYNRRATVEVSGLDIERLD